MVDPLRSDLEAAVDGDGDKTDILEVAAEPAADAVAAPAPVSPVPEDGMGRELGAILDEALDRMERRVVGDERPIPLPWSNVSAALGGGLWGERWSPSSETRAAARRNGRCSSPSMPPSPGCPSATSVPTRVWIRSPPACWP